MKLRTSNIEQLAQGRYDVLVIGGGINGAVRGGCLVWQGRQAALIEQRDFAGFTSQQSSNLAWGGIKYLESLDFRAGQRSLPKPQSTDYELSVAGRGDSVLFDDRKGLSFSPAVHLVGYLGLLVRSVAPSPKRRAGCRSRWSMPRNLRQYGSFLRRLRILGCPYLHDNDARFVFQFVRSAMDRGCIAANYVESLGARREGGEWITQARDAITRLGNPLTAARASAIPRNWRRYAAAIHGRTYKLKTNTCIMQIGIRVFEAAPQAGPY